jgi:protein tyrosine/serine phosphatase
MPRPLRYGFGLLITFVVVGGPILYSNYRQSEVRAFRVVRDGVLYRSGQLSLDGFKRVVREYDIKCVVSLRDAIHPGDTPPDWEEEKYCKAEEITYVRITPERWWASDDSVPAEKGIRRFRAVMDDPANYPVLIHCFAGVHRTGAYCAVYRMEYEHWSNAEAIAEMRSCGYRNIDDEYDLLSYLEGYRPRWKGPDAHAAAGHSESHYRAVPRHLLHPGKHTKRKPRKASS